MESVIEEIRNIMLKEFLTKDGKINKKFFKRIKGILFKKECKVTDIKVYDKGELENYVVYANIDDKDTYMFSDPSFQFRFKKHTRVDQTILHTYIAVHDNITVDILARINFEEMHSFNYYLSYNKWLSDDVKLWLMMNDYIDNDSYIEE